jgi:Rap1a immunity proteins
MMPGRLRWKAFMVLLLLLIQGTARADELSAGDVYSFCSDRSDATQAACRFFILGAVLGIEYGDGAALGSAGLVTRIRTQFCLPPNVSQSQMVAIFQSAMTQLKASHPEDLKLPAVPLVGAALGKAFPCPKSN